MGDPFAPIEAFGRVMDGFPHPWFVSGGWAIDLFRDQVTREHEDLEVGIFRADQGALYRHLAGWRLFTARDGEWVPLEEDEYVELPHHQVLARPPDGAARDPPEFEFFLNDTADGMWLFRRNPATRHPLATLILRSARGLPIIAPEAQLLHKARLHRPKDEHDFRGALPLLSAEQRGWLRAATSDNFPGDPWLEALAEG